MKNAFERLIVAKTESWRLKIDQLKINKMKSKEKKEFFKRQYPRT